MPTEDKDKEKQNVTPAELLLEEVKQLRAEVAELKKQNAEYKEFAVAATKRTISEEPVKEKSGDKLDEIVANYKKGDER